MEHEFTKVTLSNGTGRYVCKCGWESKVYDDSYDISLINFDLQSHKDYEAINKNIKINDVNIRELKNSVLILVKQSDVKMHLRCTQILNLINRIEVLEKQIEDLNIQVDKSKEARKQKEQDVISRLNPYAISRIGQVGIQKLVEEAANDESD